MGLIAGLEGPYSVYVHSRQEHPPPHCHLYIRGDGYVRVNLLTLAFMDVPPKGRKGAITRIVRQNRDKALREWERLNELRDQTEK